MRLLTTFALAVTATALADAPAYAAYTASISGGNATFTGGGASDTLVIDSSGGLLRHNRPASEGFSSAFDFNTATAGDQTLSDATTTSVNVNAGGGDDSVVFGTPAVPAAGIQANMFANGEAGTDSVTYEDSADPVGHSFEIFAFLFPAILKSGGGGLTYPAAESVSIALGSGPDRLSVYGSIVGMAQSLALGDGNDIVDFAPDGRQLDAFGGPFTVDGGAGIDQVSWEDSGQTAAQQYTVTSSGLTRPGIADFGFTALERGRLDTGSAADTIGKNGSVPFTIDAGAGDDVIGSRDDVGDAVACLGGADTLTADLADVAGADCETTDRPAPPPPPDTAAPTFTFGKLPKTVKRKLLIRGLKVTLGTTEPALVVVEERAAARGAKLARNYNLVLARKSVSVTGTGTVTLKAPRRVVGKSKRFSVRLSATATDAAGNTSKRVTRTIKVKR